ncbi:ABC transporter permease [[Brevibacterium] frigoritolerans]|nr:ABC transporter permease [Peribacillus frigoritolerans]
MLFGAIKNELEKLYLKRRIHVVTGIILVFAVLMLVIDYVEKDEIINDWKAPMESQVSEINAYLNTQENKESTEYKDMVNQREKLEYHLSHDINPELEGAAESAISGVTGMFIKIILPILIVIVTADILTGESSNGTLKSLLVSPMGRKNLLFSKWIAAIIISIGAMLFSDLLSYISAIPFSGLGNWNDLVVVGQEDFRGIPAWEYMIKGLLLNTLMIITLTSVFLLVSVLFQSVAISISLSICIVVFGGILASLQSKIDVLKYFFILNLDMGAHLTGQFDLTNTSLTTSSLVMVVTLILSFGLSFSIFTKKDLLV